ncbi:MAG: CRISPR-associated endoribonuclease Cas6 [Candidatus Methanoliparum thermophilum]|uniref:CRISPR-associated endoribonuclease n=1 Tax=Methanoliparum thermophilum TaxID=2491083 RepID=A0A520KTS5_METT2|nr:CRISPR-associated endoribonuclease Cas6 [Candidatus Methanoliparum sp. LAM-1]RZN65482.1 MAG: CRISPR-associated endoribonuclease Cas6 [Candidatus Methanoliparum thermophilum]
MRIKLKILSKKDRIVLPLYYNYYLQSFLYANISPELASFLHDKGFEYEKRSFKMFTFSKLIGRYEIKNGTITFILPVKFIISSPLDRFVSELANTMLTSKLKLFGEDIYVEEMEVLGKPEIKSRMEIRMMTPLVAYSTLITPEGRKKTYYYNPLEPEFAELIDRNLRKKHEAFYGKKPRARKTSIKPIVFNERVLKYRDNVIKGYTGKFIIDGNKKLLELAYDCGLGSKNSQGFGMFDPA